MVKKKISIDKERFESVCTLQFTQEEVVEHLGVTDKEIEEWCDTEYSEPYRIVYARLKYQGQEELRAKQFALASKSPTMAIHLGKKYLNDEEPTDSGDKDEYSW